MVAIRLTFEPWRPLKVFVDDAAHLRFMREVASRAAMHFKAGVSLPGTGRLYTKELRIINGRVVPVGPRSKPHVASAKGHYPSTDTGGLKSSIRHDSNDQEAKVGSTRSYAIYLRKGTSRMTRRKMSDNALRETLPLSIARKSPFARMGRA